MKEIHFCEECGTSYGVEDHHIVFLSQVAPLDKCKANHAWLCHYHHRDHKAGVHHNDYLDNKYKLRFQNWLEMKFLKESFTLDEIQKVLGISSIAVNKLSKHMWSKDGKYAREDIIRSCMGGRLILEDEIEEVME